MATKFEASIHALTLIYVIASSVEKPLAKKFASFAKEEW